MRRSKNEIFSTGCSDCGVVFILATVWMFFPEQLLTQWGIEPTPGTALFVAARPHFLQE
jgi:hypothetical protein